MDNYLIMGHILRCKLIPKDQVHPELWVGANRKWRAVPRDRLARVEHNKVARLFFILWHSCPDFEFVFQHRTESEQMRTNKRLLKRQNERKRKLEQAGIEYDFEAVSYVRFFGSHYLIKANCVFLEESQFSRVLTGIMRLPGDVWEIYKFDLTIVVMEW